MSVRELLGSKRLWIAAAGMLTTLAVLCAVGAWMQQGGVLSQSMGNNWATGACLASGVIGGWVASGGRRGGLTRAGAAALIAAVQMLPLGAVLTGGVSLSAQSVRCLAALLLGAALPGFLKALRQGRRGQVHTRRRTPGRAVRRG